MEEKELKNIWKNSSNTEDISFNASQLLVDFKKGMEAKERVVRRRDRREIIGALLGAVYFGYSFFTHPNIVSRIGALLGLVVLVYVIFKLRINRKSKFIRELFLPIRDQLGNQKQFMQHQYRLLDTVIYWLCIPIFIAHVIFVWGISKSEDSLTIFEQLVARWELKLIMTLIFALLFGFIGLMNKKAAKINWEPLIKQVDNILDNLKKD